MIVESEYSNSFAKCFRANFGLLDANSISGDIKSNLFWLSNKLAPLNNVSDIFRIENFLFFPMRENYREFIRVSHSKVESLVKIDLQ